MNKFTKVLSSSCVCVMLFFESVPSAYAIIGALTDGAKKVFGGSKGSECGRVGYKSCPAGYLDLGNCDDVYMKVNGTKYNCKMDTHKRCVQGDPCS